MVTSASIEFDTVESGIFGVTQNIEIGAISSGSLGGTINGGGVVTGDVVLHSPVSSIRKGIATMTGGNSNTHYQFFYNTNAQLTATDPNTQQEYTADAVISGPGSFQTDNDGDGQALLSFTVTVPGNVPPGLHFQGSVTGIEAKIIYPQP